MYYVNECFFEQNSIRSIRSRTSPANLKPPELILYTLDHFRRPSRDFANQICESPLFYN